jgi:nickel/cobalt transporter (NicO) family protein
VSAGDVWSSSPGARSALRASTPLGKTASAGAAPASASWGIACLTIAEDYHRRSKRILALAGARGQVEGCMTSAMLFGASSGALHAVTGPDHVLSLGPLVLDTRRSPWRIGMSWGIGHALGTLLLALPAVWFTQAVHLPWLAAVGDRLAGLALLLTAAWSFYQARAHGLGAGGALGDGARTPATTPGIGRNAFLVGVVHGLTGAASLMLVVPMLATGSRVASLAFLFAFALGSTLGMALLTSLLARLGSRLEPRVLGRSRALLCAASGALGCFWLLVG